MAGTEGFLELAGIAGVFIGFAALIAVRGGGATELAEIAYMRTTVTMATLAVVAALLPVTLARFDLGEHTVWAASTGLVILGWIVAFVAIARTPEYRTGMAAEIDASRARPRLLGLVQWAPWALYMGATVAIPAVILLGLVPGLDAALFFAEVVLIILGAAWSLLTLVFLQHAETA